MKNARWIVGLALLFALGAGLLSSTRVQADENDNAAIRKLCSTFVMTWNKHDAAGMAGVFSENGDLLGPDGVRHEGRKAVQAALAMWHGPKGPMHASTVKVLDEPLRMITADVAISDAEIVVSNVMDADGDASSVPMHVTNVWKKSGGTWSLNASRSYVKQAHDDDDDDDDGDDDGDDDDDK
jgi:uncharacterized protein (TIGR02246 family)